MGIEKEVLPVFIVALLTWGGVFLYMLRLERLAREVEKEINRRDAEERGEKDRESKIENRR